MIAYILENGRPVNKIVIDEKSALELAKYGLEIAEETEDIKERYEEAGKVEFSQLVLAIANLVNSLDEKDREAVKRLI